MCQRRRRATILVGTLCVTAAVAAPAVAQTAEERALAEDASLEAFLESNQLDRLLAAHLRDRLNRLEGVERLATARRLGQLYIRLLTDAPTPDERLRWERDAEELMASVPEADTFELQIGLARARYLVVEPSAERFRLRMTTPEEDSATARTLGRVTAQLRRVLDVLDPMVQRLEFKEERASREQLTQVRDELELARQQRSLAAYYLGWSSYYIALVTDDRQSARRGLVYFGIILGAMEDKPASVDRVPAANLRFEHVARAAIGCALCASMLGEEAEAEAWMQLLDRAEALAPGVEPQMFSRKVSILADARRWADLDLLVSLRRGRSPSARALDVSEARLLAVVTLDMVVGLDQDSYSYRTIRGLTEVALVDLISRHELQHVVDIARRYGLDAIGREGFIPTYVDATLAQDRAETLTGSDAQDIPNAFMNAAAAWSRALAQPDAMAFAPERGDARYWQGYCEHMGLAYSRAAETLDVAMQDAVTEAQHERAHWWRVLSLQEAARTDTSKAPMRDAEMLVYLTNYAGTERAARLVIQYGAGLGIDDERAAGLLLAVPPDSPLYAVARSQAAGRLYRLYRRAPEADRQRSALRFLDVADELDVLERHEIAGEDEARARGAAGRASTRLRQMIDVALGMPDPDVDRAERALAHLDAIAAYAELDEEPWREELAFRQIQIALLRGQTDDAEQLLGALESPRYRDAGVRLVFSHSLKRWRQSPDDAGLAQTVVDTGQRVIQSMGGADAAAATGEGLGVLDALGSAAESVFAATSDAHYASLGIAWGQAAVAQAAGSDATHARLARLLEAMGEHKGALDQWRILVSARADGTEAWFEARFHSLRLLREFDPDQTREVMRQHRALHNGYGPLPWGPRIRELDKALNP